MFRIVLRIYSTKKKRLHQVTRKRKIQNDPERLKCKLKRTVLLIPYTLLPSQELKLILHSLFINTDSYRVALTYQNAHGHLKTAPYLLPQFLGQAGVDILASLRICRPGRILLPTK